MCSVVIGDQRPLDGFGGGPVVPDGGSHGQQPLGDPGVDARGGPAAVPFEVEHLARPLRCRAIASARLKNGKVDAAILAQLLRADLLPEAWIAPPQVRQLRRCCATGPAWCGWAPSCATGSTRWPLISATTAPAVTGLARAAAGWPSWTCRRCRGRSSPTA
jgi:hypothetical protein